MTKSKKISNLFLALAFSCLTCGTAMVATLPGVCAASQKTQIGEVKAETPNLKSVVRDGKTFYQISSADQFVSVSYNVSIKGDVDWAKANYELTADMKLEGKEWTPIGTATNPFTGYFNGNGFTINGVVSTKESSADTYCGLFGYVDGAHIYDCVIGTFAYGDASSTSTSGRFVGYAKNAVLADIYDMTFVNTNTPSERTVKTIGTVNNCSYYIGDTFYYNANLYRSNTGVDESISVEGGYDASHKQEAKGPQFDWTTNTSSSCGGYSVAVFADSESTIYKKGDSSKKAIDYYRVLVDASGTAVSGVVSSDKYYQEFAQEEILADNATAPAAGQPVMSPVLGKKLVGWKTAGEGTSATTVKTWFGATKNLWVQPDWKELVYDLTIVADDGTAVGTIQNVKYNTPWSELASSIDSKRSGYDLTKVHKAYVDGATTTKELTYYTSAVKYDASYNKTITPTYNYGTVVNHWDSGTKTTVPVKIYTSWLGSPINAVVQFAKSANDGGAIIDDKTVSSIDIAYVTTPSGAPALALSSASAASGKYTFKSIADQSLSLTFKLKGGYKVSAVKCSPNGNATYSLSNGTYTVTITGLLSNSDTITIEVERETTTIALSKDANTTLALSGNSKYTSISGSTLTTRIDETFNIVASFATGYEYNGYDASGWGTISAPSIDKTDGKATFAVSVTEYSTTNKLSVTAKQKVFKVNLTFSYEAYASDANAKPAAIALKAGEDTLSTNASQEKTFALVSSATLSAPANEYYGVGTAAITTQSGGSAALTKTGDGAYTLEGISNGAVINITISYTKQTYNATFKSSFKKSGESWPGVLGVDGKAISNTESVITFTPRSYKYKDTITLTYNIVSQYYEFVGWYYENGEQISTSNNATVTALASNMTFYGVVQGKTASAKLVNSTILANYDGVADKYVNKGSAVNTGAKDLSYTYSSPENTNAAFTATAVNGYYIHKGIVHKSNWAGLNGTALAGTAGTDYVLFDVTALTTSVSSKGYGDLAANVRDFIFANPGCVIEFIGAQKAVNLQFVAGDGATGTAVTKTYYYGGSNVSVADIAFTKTGYSTSGWTYAISGTTYTRGNVDEILFGDEILSVVKVPTYGTLTITRTYSANTYTITLDPNGGECKTEELSITFDSTTKFTIAETTRTGHTFKGWSTAQNGGSIVIDTNGNLVANVEGYTDANGKWIHAGKVKLYANWSAVQYTVKFDANGGSVDPQSSVFTFGEAMAALADIIPTRAGFSFDGWHYIYDKAIKVDATTILNKTNFAGGEFGVKGGECSVTLYAKWTFDFTLDVNKTVAVDYGTTITNQFGIAVTFNGATKNIDSTSQEMPAGLAVESWGWTQSTTGDKIYAPAMVNAGTYTLTYTLKLKDSGSSQDLLRHYVENVESISYTINAVKLSASINTTATQLNAIAANLAQLALDTQPILKLVDGDGYMAGVSGGTWTSLETYVSGLAKGTVTSAKAWSYVMTKAMMAYKFMSKSDEAFSTAKFYTNTALKTMSFSDFLTKYNSAASFDVTIADANADYFAYAMQKYASDTTALNIGLSGNVYTTAIVNGVSTTIPVSTVISPNDGKVGKHTLSFQIDISKVTGFTATNYSNITKVSDNIYALNVEASQIANNKIVQAYVYRKPVVFTMSETTAIVRTNPYEFTLVVKDGETTKYTAKVKTTSGAAGAYRFADGTLVVESISPAIAANEFAYVDGVFTIREAPSTISFSAHTITATSDRTGVNANIIEAEKIEANKANYYMTVASVSVGGNSYSIESGKEVYYDLNGNFVFQIVDNGTISPTIYAATGSYTFKVAIASVNPQTNRHLIEIVQWKSDYDYAKLLREKTAFASGSYSQELANVAIVEKENYTFSAIYSEAAYVTIASAPEKTFNTGNYYVNFADTAFTVPTTSANNAYKLNNWTAAKGSTVASGKVTLAAVPTETLTANYVLATPSVSATNVSVNAANGTAKLDELTTVAVSNNDESITYTYTWYKKSGSTYTALNSTTIPATEYSNGTYAVVVTASKSGYAQAASGYVNFTVEFKKLTITLSASATEATYNNTDFATAGYTITAAGGISKTYTVKELIAENSKVDADRLFEVSLTKNGQNVTEIKSVGTYKLVVSLFASKNTDNAYYAKNIYNTLSSEFTFTVNAAQIAYATYYNNSTKFSKTFREEEPSLTLKLTLNSEEVVVTYTRAAGETVGTYDLKTASISNSNYVLVSEDGKTTATTINLPAGNGRFTIAKIDDYTITAKATVNGTLIYNNTTPTISETTYANGAWTFTVTNGAQTVKITLSDLKEGGTTGVPADYVASALSGLKFSFEQTEVKNAGSYTLTTNWTSEEYPGGFAFEGTKPSIVIEKAKIAYDSYYQSFEKTYGDNDPALTRTLELNNEDVVVTFTRQAGEKVGSYKLNTAIVGNSNYLLENNEGNYVETATLKDNKGFTVSKRDPLKLQFSLASRFEKTYYGAAPAISETATYANGKWTITVGGETIALISAIEVENGNRNAPIDEDTFKGVKFALNATANVGKYTITASLNAADSATYTTVELTNGTDAVEITPYVKEVAYADLKSITGFSKNFRAEDPATISATVTYVGSEVVTLTFTREAGENVGKYALTLNSVSSTNYNLTIPTNTWFEIKKVDSSAINVTASDVTLVYNNQVPTITSKTVDGTSFKLVISNGNEVTLTLADVKESLGAHTWAEGELQTILDKTTFEITGAKKDVGDYAIKASLVHDNYPAGMNLSVKLHITPYEVSYANYKKSFSKDYGANDPVLENTEAVGVNGETFTVTFTRANGTVDTEKVGTYNLASATTANGNYTLATLPTNNALFTITARSGLVISATVSGSISHTYDKTAANSTVEATYNGADNTYTLTVKGTDNTVWGTLTLSKFVETSESYTSAITAYAGYLKGLSFSITCDGNVGNYAIAVSGHTTDSNSTFEFTNPAAAVVNVTALKVELTAGNFAVGKVYGADDVLTKTFTTSTKEDIEIAFTRTAGEKVGGYQVLTASTANTNFAVALSTENPPKFVISKASDLALTFSISGKISKEYNNTAPNKVELSYNQNQKQYSISVYSDATLWGTFTLNDVTDGTKAFAIDEHTFDGVTFAIANSSANVGSYDITVTMNASKNATYTAATLTGGTGAIEITSVVKTVALGDFKSNNFTKVFRGEEPSTISGTVEYVTGDPITLTFTRTAGEDVGTYDLTLNSGYNSNYILSIPANNKWFTITAVDGLKVSASAESASITYTGKDITIEKAYEAASGWSLKIKSGTEVVGSIALTSFQEKFTPAKSLTAVEKTLEGITFTLSTAAKNVGTYTINVSGHNSNYPGGFVFDGTAPTLTINPVKLDSFTKAFEKTYGDSDSALTNSVNGVNGESVTITFERAAGENVGSYALTKATSSSANYVLKGGDGNYAQEVELATNALFTIKAYPGLKISATADKSVSLTYSGKELSLETAFEGSTYVLKIKDGSTVVETITLKFNTFKENFETPKAITPYSGMLNGITFGFDQETVKNVGAYNIVATGTTANYPGGFVFDGTAPTLTITQATITLAHDADVMTKVYGTENKTITNVVKGVNGENVTIVYTRAEGEKVGKYEITEATILSTETDNVNNYKLSLPHNTDWFEITKPENLAISFSLKETFTKTYDTTAVTVSENATYANGKWTITIGGKTFELDLFKEGESTSTVTPDERTLVGVSFSIAEAKNVGSYEIVATMTGENATYSSVSFNGKDAVEITKVAATLSLNDLTIVNGSFTKAFRAAEPTITATANPTGSEELTLTFTRAEGEDVGKYAIKAVAITAGGSAGNYNLSIPEGNDWFEITAVSTAAISVNATGATLVYTSQALTVTKETEVGKLTVSNGNTATITISDFAEVVTGAKTLTAEQISDIWANTTFAIAEKKNVGTYTITATLAHKNYPAGITITGGEITIKAKDITISSENPLFTKTYKEYDPELVMTFTNSENDAIFAGDSVKVTFARTSNGDETEAVGKYELSVASWDNQNYNVTVAAGNEYFQIKPLEGLFVTATISGTTNTFTYDGAKTYTITSAYKEESWVLTVAGYGITNAEFVLSDLHEYKSADGSTTAISNISTALEGMTFEFDRNVKDVGNYTIIGKKGTNGTYTGITITNSLSVITVVKKDVAVKAEFSKDYGVESDGELKKSYTSAEVSDIVSGDIINVEFERVEGEKVGDYKLSIVSSDNDNYNVSLDSTSKFTINKLTNLELSFTISGSYTKTYDAKTVSVSENATYADGKWTITITDGEKSQVLEITNFVEVELENRTITADDKTLSGVVFSIKDNAKDVGSYSIVATLTGANATYTKVEVESESKVVIEKLTKVLSRSDLTTDTFAKVFREVEPTITAKANPTGNEQLTLTFSRAAGENVGEYAVSLTGGFNTTNYALSIPENTWFEITAAASSKITASADIKTFKFVYDGTTIKVSEPTYNAESKTWSIVVSNKTQSQTIVLSNFVESVTGKAVPDGEDLSALLAGITFAFDGGAKDAASYTLSATTNGTNKNYLQGFEFVGGAPELTIEKATISIPDSDTPLFTKTYRDNDPTLSKSFDGVNGETVVVVFTRDKSDTVASERVGKHALATATTENGNYDIQLAKENSLFEIVRRAGMKLQATIAGEYSKQYDATAVAISGKATCADGTFTLTIEGTETKFTLSGFTEIAGQDTWTAPVDKNLLDGYTFSIQNASANKGTYTIVVSGSDNTYEGLVFVTPATVEITAREVELTSKNFEIGKTYGDLDVLTKEVSTEWGAFNATITRMAGEKVGSYAIESVTSDNDNFAPYLSSSDAPKYVIARRESLTLSFALKQVYTKTYDAKEVSISSTATYAGGKWTITLDETTYELVDFKEVELGRAAPVVDEDTLANVTFSLSATAKDVKSYNIVASIAEGGNTTYTAISFTGGENAVVISKLEKTLELERDLTIVGSSFTKVFRAEEPTITAKANPTGNEELTLTFTRVAGENVGKYAINSVAITAGGNADNYSLSVPAVNDWFEITKNSASAITATADVDKFEFTYDASVPAVSAPVYDASTKTWSVVVSNKAELKTIVLSNFVETVGNGYVLTDSDYANLLNGISFKLVKFGDTQVDAVADAGEYKLVAVGGNDNYPAGFAFIESKNPVLTIAPVTITIADGEPIFVKTYRDADPTLAAEYNGVNGEKVTVTFTRDTTAADAERVGSHALATATTENGNYNISLTTPNSLFRIDRRDGLNIQGSITGTVRVREYNGVAPTKEISISDNTDGTFTLTLVDGTSEFKFTLASLTEVGGGLDSRTAPYFADMLSGIVFSIENPGKDVGDYSITTDGSTNTYGKLVLTGDVKVMEITKAVIKLEEGKTQFSKTYGDSDPELSLTLSHSDYDSIVDGETVSVTLSRENGESVGSYALNNAETTNTNYSISLGENKWFAITKRAGLVLRATLTGDKIEKTYNGLVPTLELSANGTITVKDSEMTWGTFTLTSLTEYAAAVGEGSAFERAISLGANTFSGLQLKIDGASKNSGLYSIVTDGTWDYDTYTTFEFVDESNKNVISITPYEIVLVKDETAFTKTYGDVDKEISNEVNGVGSEKITIAYTREQGEDVGSYNIATATISDETDAANYSLTLAENNAWFTITAYEGLKLSASANKEKVSFVYANKVPTISQEVTNGLLQLAITVGNDKQEITVGDFKELFASVVSVDDVAHALSGITFKIAGAAKDVNVTGYEVVAECTNANYPGGFVFEKALYVEITAAPITLTKENTSFSKIYNTLDADAFPSGLVKTYPGQNGEIVTVTFEREQGEDVGSYDLSIKTVSSTNYSVTIPEDNKWFEILVQDGLGITAKVVGDALEVDYAGLRNFTVAAEYTEEKWYLAVYEDESFVTKWELTNFKEFKDEAENEITPKANTLTSIRFSLDRIVKDKGTYSIVASGANAIYPIGFKFTGSADFIVVKAKQLTLSDITKQFDQTTVFDSSVANNSVKVNGLVGDETVVVKGQFANIGVGENIEISGIEISGEHVGNYTLASTTLAGSITKSEKKVALNVSETSYTYGELTEGLSEIVVSATIDGKPVDAYVTCAPSIEDATYSTGKFLNKGTYVLKITPSSDYYTVEDYTVEITVSTLEISVYVDGEITKVYDKDMVVEQSLSLETILTGDIVDVSGAYISDQPGSDIDVTFSLSGADAGNYVLSNPAAKGKIERAIINVAVEINTTEFVDGVGAAGTTSFNVAYPFENSASDVYDSLSQPTKTGYEFAGWKYGLDKAELTTENITDVFDSALESKELTLYADWTINTYTVTIKIDESQGSYVAVPEGQKDGFVHTYNYFDTITITSTAKVGYVAVNSTQQIVNITEDMNISVEFRPAEITFNVSVDKSSLYPYGEAEIAFGGNWTPTSEGTSASRTIAFTALDDALAKDFLPTILVKGYTLAGWASGEKNIAVDAEDTLKDVILALNNSFTNDISLDFTTSFTAKQYKISFVANGDDENPSDQDVTYGAAVGTLPEVTKAGFNFGGWRIDGKTVTKDTIFDYDEDITLTALWTAGVYGITVKVDHATVNIKEQVSDIAVLPEEGIYMLDHNYTYVLTVTAEAGYRVASMQESENACDFSYELSGDNATAQIANIFKLGAITIATEAKENTFTVSIDHAKINVTVDGAKTLEDAIPENGEGGLQPITFVAKTAQTVIIEVIPDAGYDVSLDVVNGATCANNGNAYTLTGFTSNVSINFVSAAQQHTVTFVLGAGVAGISEYQGAEKQTESTFVVKTDDVFSFALIFAYGYEFDSVSTNPEMTVEQEGESISISGFTQDFTVTIAAKKIKFSVAAGLYAIDQEGNVKSTSSFSVQAPDSAEYESTVQFVASKENSVEGYKFVGWFEGELVEVDGKVSYDLNNRISEELTYEREVSGDITITAVFQYAEFEVKAYVDGEGQIKRGDVVVADSADNSYMREMLYYGTNLSLSAVAKAGYKFSYWMIDGVRKDLLAAEFGNYTVEGAVEFTAVFEPLTVDFSIATSVSINGVRYSGEYIEDLGYGTIEWGTYDEETKEFTKDSRDNGELPLVVKALSGVKIYVRIVEKTGYTFDGLYNNTGKLELITNKLGDPTPSEEGNVYIYEIDGINADNAGRYGLTAVFIAKSSKVTLIYRDDDKQVDAGRIEVAVVPGVAVSGNSTSNVIVDVVTGKTLDVTASARFGTSFKLDENGFAKIDANGLTVSNITTDSEDLTQRGFAERIKFNLAGFTGEGAEVVIHVQSTVYTVKLVGFDENNNYIYGGPDDPKVIENVTAGQPLDLTGITMPAKAGYSFAGFYTYLAGAGKQYINADGEAVAAWTENGYSWNGNIYEQDPFYDKAAKQFTLYASFIINKTKFEIDAIPPELKELGPTVAARVVITSLNEANSWTTEDDIYMAEVLYGADATIKAPTYEGYNFAMWKIIRTDSQGNETTDFSQEESLNVIHNNFPYIKLYAIYDALVSISGNNGGNIYYTYTDRDGVEQTVEDSAYVPTTSNIVLHAIPENGYEFLGWYDENDTLISEQSVFTIEATEANHIAAASYKALFKGKDVTLYIGEYDTTPGRIVDIQIDGVSQGADGTIFRVNIGSEVIFFIEKSSNFELIFSGAEVSVRGERYIYKVAYKDVDPESYSLTLTPVFTQLACDVEINVKLIGDGIKENELPLAGTIRYFDAEGNKIALNGGSVTFSDKVGRELVLEVIPNINYKIASVMHDNQDVTGQIVAGRLSLTLNYIRQDIINDGGKNVINIEIQRDMWTDLVNEDYLIKGEGTRSNPYLIDSAEDLAFVAYMVNILKNGNYTNANYKLTANISLAGRYWAPIGIEENPFNGTFNFDVFAIEDVSVVFGYTGDLDTTKVFGYLGPNARFTEANQELMIILIVVGVVVGLTATALVIFLVLRRKRRKKLEELQNS